MHHGLETTGAVHSNSRRWGPGFRAQRAEARVGVGQGRAGQGGAGQGRAGQGRAGQGRAGQGRALWVHPGRGTSGLVQKQPPTTEVASPGTQHSD